MEGQCRGLTCGRMSLDMYPEDRSSDERFDIYENTSSPCESGPTTILELQLSEHTRENGRTHENISGQREVRLAGIKHDCTSISPCVVMRTLSNTAC
jgi:hypothetical protein